MSKSGLLGAAAALAIFTGPAMFAGPATAQQVISEPGYCAFFYPNANCQNKGPGNPYTDGNYQRGVNERNAMAGADQTAGAVRKRSRTSMYR